MFKMPEPYAFKYELFMDDSFGQGWEYRFNRSRPTGYERIRNLLQLNQGSVIELDRLAGEPLDVLVNGTLIAHGEVVVVNEKFGIRMTDVISPAERIKKLR